MRWYQRMNENIKTGIRSWLDIKEASPHTITINQTFDFEGCAARNRIWFRGDSSELHQLYAIEYDIADRFKFWAARPTPGLEIRQIHTGLPGIIVRTLCGVVLPDMNTPDFVEPTDEELWEQISGENAFDKILHTSLKDALVVGDGALKVTFDTSISQMPILEWYPGDRVTFVRNRGRLTEIIFKTPYAANKKRYVLFETYGRGYIKYDLTLDGKSVPLESIEATRPLQPVTFDAQRILAVPLKIYESAKWEGRGASIFDGKLDNFDALDEAWSQWMEAVRAGRAKTYIPDSLIPKDPDTGKNRMPNAFDDKFIMTETNMAEGAQAKISTEQPAIPHESYLASYVTALDLCLQGVISPSTLGIDMKKLDNAEATREKEKATLYTRNSVIEALTEFVRDVIDVAINAVHILNKQDVKDVDVDVTFGEYANPSFEAVVQTVSQARQSGIASIEACVDELYGDTKDEAWKEAEVKRLKEEQGVAAVEEPGLATEGITIEGSSSKPSV